MSTGKPAQAIDPERCSCKFSCCQGAYAHCLRHANGCHLMCRPKDHGDGQS